MRAWRRRRRRTAGAPAADGLGLRGRVRLSLHAGEGSRARAAGKRAHKYHGKWAFVRLAGLQEPLSSAASVANLLAARSCATAMAAGGARRAGALWMVYTAVHVNAWVWSTVSRARHARYRGSRLPVCGGLALCRQHAWLRAPWPLALQQHRYAAAFHAAS